MSCMRDPYRSDRSRPLYCNNIQTALKEILSKVNPSDTKALQAASKKARDLILSSEIPDNLAQGITSACKKLSAIYKEKKAM